MIVRLKGVKKVRSKGRTYYYHRQSMTRLPGTPSSPEFMRALSSLSRTTTTFTAGSLGVLISRYRSSPEFAGLAPATRKSYQQVFDWLKDGIDKEPIVNITTELLYRVRDKANRERKRSFANRTLSVLRLVFNWGMRRGQCKANPALAVEMVRRPRSTPTKNRPWRPQEFEAVMSACPPWFRVALALAAYTGLRESDVVRVSWECYDGRTFETRAQKTGVPIWVPAHSKLREVLDVLPRGETIVLGTRGRPITTSFIRTTLYETIGPLVTAGRVAPGLSFHGLRHTLGTALAEAGCDPPTIAGVLGQSTTQMAEHYSRTANRRGLVSDAMKKLENEAENRDTSH